MKWEYMTELFDHGDGAFLMRKVDLTNLTEKLNERANDDWELVSTSEAHGRWQILLVFRRPIPSE